MLSEKLDGETEAHQFGSSPSCEFKIKREKVRGDRYIARNVGSVFAQAVVSADTRWFAKEQTREALRLG